MLETIVRQPDVPTRTTPLLFVHGAWHAAWCWDEYFMPYLAGQGYACHAVSLRGHGSSDGRERLRWTRLHDYVEDVAETVAQLAAVPVLVGHSMGAFVVQKYLERHSAAGAVLLASIPPTGAIVTTLRVLRRDPLAFVKANATMSLAPIVATPQMARKYLFSASMPGERVSAYHRRLQDESYLAFLDLIAFALVRTTRVKRVPMLVIGGGHDTLVSPGEVRRTAEAYGTRAEIFPGMAHDLMLDVGWERVAERMARWLNERPA